MNDNTWYSSQNADYRQVYPTPDSSIGRVAADSVQDAHRLLTVYPFSSATPTTHGLYKVFFAYTHIFSFFIVARHLSNLTISPVSSNFAYMQPHYQIPGNAPYEYAEEINYLSSARPPGRDGGYWDMVRNDAVRLLNDQSTPCVKRSYLIVNLLANIL
jgi:cohesin loading factor subunit SCC2